MFATVPTLPLIDDSLKEMGNAHGVRAPGGYEVWRLVAHDSDRQTWIDISFHLGFACYGYLRRYLRYRRWPTRFAPPLPVDYPAVSIAIYSENRLVASTIQFPPAPFVARGPVDIRSGDHRLAFDANGTIRVQAAGTELLFLPREQNLPIENPKLPEGPHSPIHRWVAGTSLCDVHGTLEVGETKIPFIGTGIQYQEYGGAPGRLPSLRGQLFLKKRAVLIHGHDILQVAKFEAGSVQFETDLSIGAARTVWRLSYPQSIRTRDRESLVLTHPRVIYSKPLKAWLVYEATLDREKGTALCEMTVPHRLTWPVLGRLMEASSRDRTILLR